MKAQTSIEFLTYFGIMLVALSLLSVSLIERQGNFFDFRDRTTGESILIDVAEDVERVEIHDKTVSKEVDYPEQIFGANYTIRADNSAEELELILEDSPDNKRVAYPMRYSGSSFEINSEDFPVEIESSDSGVEIN